jgi:hypothetical protein
MEMPDYIKRMIIEKEELYDKVDKCIKFITGEKFTTLNGYQKELLIKQHKAMINYLIILNTRINYEKELLYSNTLKEDLSETESGDGGFQSTGK